MADHDDAFDRLLRGALAPVDREEDGAFVARVQATIAVEQLWAARRREAWRPLFRDLIAVLSLGIGAAAALTAPSLAGAVTADQALTLAALIIGFGAWVGLLTRPGSPSSRRLV